ncbi:hypothetical protein [Glycocaulis alkaliphilus]|nr:hypothetical protein [Glycocaulis alkaliphilus]GGB78067.1 hypothetical protein GCM10007417_17470 [Glycocaulis alkaliphilus]
MTENVDIQVCDVRHIVHMRFPSRVSAGQLREIIGQLMSGAIPADYNILLDFTQTEQANVPATEILDLAMKRRKMLPAHPLAPVRTAVLGVKTDIEDALDAWESFLTESPPAVIFNRFDSETQALAWLTEGRQAD